MRTKLMQVHTRLNDAFSLRLAAAFAKKFDVQITTRYAVFTGRMVTERHDEQQFPLEQRLFLEAFEAGYLAAMDVVNDARTEDDRKRIARAARREGGR